MAKDPPLGRWGFVVENSFGDGKTQNGRREIRCNGCRVWFDACFHRCPECEHARPGFNKHIRTSQLNRHLAGYADVSNRQPKYAPNITSDVAA